MSRVYALDARAAARLKEMFRSSAPPAPDLRAEIKQSIFCIVKIEANESAGVYKAIEVFWDGGAWVTNALSRKFGAAYSTLGVRDLGGSTDIPKDTLLIVMPFQPATATGMAEWVFGQPISDDWHPFKSRVKPGTMDTIEVGYLRSPVYSPPDEMSIFDASDTTMTDQIVSVPDTDPVDSGALSGDGYLYYLLKRDVSGGWSYDDAPQRPHASNAWPPTPDVRDRIPVMIGTFKGAGLSTFSWHQVLRDDPVIWPRPAQPSFWPIYCTDPSPSEHRAVSVSAGKVYFRSDAQFQVFDIPVQLMDLTVSKYYYLEVTTTPGNASHVDSVVQKVEPAYPGHVLLPGKIYILVGRTDGTRYTPNVVGDIHDGTVFQPKFTVNTFVDQQGVRAWAGNVVHIEGAGVANSDFLEIWKPGLHWKFGDLDKNDDGTPKTTVGGTDDDVVVQYVYDVVLDCSNHRLVVKHKKLTLTVQSGIVIVNKIEDEADTYINLVSVDAVTALQVSGLNFQKKTTKLYGLCNDAETGWSTWHTGTNCPTPPP